MNFADRLNKAIKEKGSVVCVGLDPVLERIPGEVIEQVTEGKNYDIAAIGEILVEFCKGIIDATADLVPAVKPQFAYFEKFGFVGMKALADVCSYAQSKDLLVIGDGKRNDIGSTAEAYAKTYLGKIDFLGKDQAVYNMDALTVTPYLGFDGIKPFIEQCEEHGKGIFILVKTSNPSSGDFQDRVVEDGITNYEYIAHFVESWGADLIGDSGYSSIGAVVGAMHPQEMKKIREILPQAIFLVPGYGAQGGSADDLKTAFNDDGLGALVNSSRAINYAYEEFEDLDYKAAARKAVEEMIEDINSIINE